MNPVHFWQGHWIDDSELERRLAKLPEWVLSQVTNEPPIEAVLQASEILAHHLARKSGPYSRLHELLTQGADLSPADAHNTLLELSEALRRESLEEKLTSELGSARPFSVARRQYRDSIFEAWAPLGLLVHISPQNAFAVGPMSVLEGLLSGNLNFLKTGGNEGPFPQAFIEALCQADSTKTLQERIIVARIPSQQKDWLTRIFSLADGIAAWGGEETLRSIRAMAPPSVRVIEWGHKISLIYVARSEMNDSSLLEKIARECCLLEQQACSSPQCVYLETSDPRELHDFGERLAEELSRISATLPGKPPGDSEAAEISMVTQCHRLESCHGMARVLEAPDRSWRILLDERPALTASPLYRSIWLKPLPRGKIIETLRPMRPYLQTAGLACPLADTYEITRALLAAGVDRIRRVGEMLGGYAGEPHDGVYALQRYCRRVTLQLRQEAAGIVSFEDLRKPDPPFETRTPPSVTRKENFSSSASMDEKASLFFKSGGSTGEPKLSTFSYDQYHEHMQLGADGLYAAGLDPLRDRCMNLFFGGGLYGGFISFFSVLEKLGAVQFPMAAHPDHEMVARIIVKNRVNVLLGMPSYILNLLESAAPVLERYQGIEKIFYGGEHFSEAQRKYLQERFGVKSIRSGAYGSVDIGPIGYQCGFCDGGVHHLQQKLHHLEILKLDQDLPVAGDEVGRLIFSPRGLNSNKPMRYEIGDVGHWIPDPGGICACGRAAPRFKLVGRMGDIFRIGSTFLNYQKFTRLLSEEAGFSGEVQVVLEEDALKEKITLKLSVPTDLAAAEAERLVLAHYPDLREAVLDDRTLSFSVALAPLQALERTAGSGKLIRVIDRRSRS